jgi:hypothetical protein
MNAKETHKKIRSDQRSINTTVKKKRRSIDLSGDDSGLERVDGKVAELDASFGGQLASGFAAQEVIDVDGCSSTFLNAPFLIFFFFLKKKQQQSQ